MSRSSYIVATIKRATNRGGLLRVLGLLASDAEATITSIDVSRPFDPFDSMYRLVYQLSHRTIGCDDIAQSPELLDKTLGIYSRLDQSNALQVMFPSLPTPNLLLKVWSGAKLFGILKDIMKKRRETGQRGQDTMQSLMDKGDSDLTICAVCIMSIPLLSYQNSCLTQPDPRSSSLHSLLEWSTVVSMLPGFYATSHETPIGTVSYKGKLMPPLKSTKCLMTKHRLRY